MKGVIHADKIRSGYTYITFAQILNDKGVSSFAETSKLFDKNKKDKLIEKHLEKKKKSNETKD